MTRLERIKALAEIIGADVKAILAKTNLLKGAAFLDVGIENNQIPLNSKVLKAYGTWIDSNRTTDASDCNDFEPGTRHIINTEATKSSPPESRVKYLIVETIATHSNGSKYQEATGYNITLRWYRSYYSAVGWDAWRMVVDSGTKTLSLSSIRIGDIAPLIAFKKLTSTYPNEGTAKSISHGLTGSKILDAVVSVNKNGIYIPSSSISGSEYKVSWDASAIIITRVSTNDTDILGKPLNVLITYEV